MDFNNWQDVPIGHALQALRQLAADGPEKQPAAALALSLLEGVQPALNGLPVPYLRVPQHYTEPCPRCGVHVRVWEPFVWTCPADSDPKDPGWLPPYATITDEMRETAEVWSNCGDDYGLGCYPRVPKHLMCC